MSRLLITAGSSYLGQSLVPLAGEQHDVCYTYFANDPIAGRLKSGAGLTGRRLDVRDPAAVTALIDSYRPDVIIHLAGSNRSRDMTAVIERGAENISRAATAVMSRLIHLSTDSIFDGRAAPYDEHATPTPLNDYGRAKAAAEAQIARHPDHVIVRTSLIYDPRRIDHSTAWIAAAMREGRPVTLFTNQLRNPVAAESLSRACLELIALPYRGVLNVAGRQRLSRAEFGRRLLDWWGVAERDSLVFGPSSGDRWPLDTTLDIRRAGRLLKTPLPGVDEMLSVTRET